MAKKTNRQQTEAQINVRAWKDPAFKKKLSENPRDALNALGMNKIPTSINIRVVEEEENQWLIRLHKPPANFKKLSEAELDKAASGEVQEATCCPKSPKS
jgi:hypothetical protein